MSQEKWSALLSAAAGISILVASFFQWWSITYNGGMIVRRWAKLLFVALIVVQAIALVLALTS